MNDQFKPKGSDLRVGHISGDKRGWYISIGKVRYLNKDGSVTYGTKGDEDSFWKTKEDAGKFISLWENDGWFQIKDCSELSVGDSYFYCNVDDIKKIIFAEFDGSCFSCEAEMLVFDDDFAYNDFWFNLFIWPDPPKI